MRWNLHSRENLVVAAEGLTSRVSAVEMATRRHSPALGPFLFPNESPAFGRAIRKHSKRDET
jgi:hypothetical protein